MVNSTVKILHAKTEKELYEFDYDKDTSVGNLKFLIERKRPQLYPDRQALRLQPKGKALSDESLLDALEWDGPNPVLYLRDLGPQIGWRTVFLTEYAGPFFIFPLFYIRPWLIYGNAAVGKSHDIAVTLGLACWSFHYAKRLYETAFVHRFSHGTMPIRNLAKNCSYYWGFAAFVAYFVCHPLYTSPSLGSVQVYSGLAIFMPTSNPFTGLFNFVSCPNYTYEVQAWIGFSIMTQCLPALIFCIVGAGQMIIWAMGKQRNYRKEFGTGYPRQRRSIIPFLI